MCPNRITHSHARSYANLDNSTFSEMSWDVLKKSPTKSQFPETIAQITTYLCCQVWPQALSCHIQSVYTRKGHVPINHVPFTLIAQWRLWLFGDSHEPYNTMPCCAHYSNLDVDILHSCDCCTLQFSIFKSLPSMTWRHPSIAWTTFLWPHHWTYLVAWQGLPTYECVLKREWRERTVGEQQERAG